MLHNQFVNFNLCERPWTEVGSVIILVRPRAEQCSSVLSIFDPFVLCPWKWDFPTIEGSISTLSKKYSYRSFLSSKPSRDTEKKTRANSKIATIFVRKTPHGRFWAPLRLPVFWKRTTASFQPTLTFGLRVVVPLDMSDLARLLRGRLFSRIVQISALPIIWNFILPSPCF